MWPYMKPKMFSFLFLDDQTRVILKEQNVSGGDYINANYVNVGHPEIGQGYQGNTGESFLFVLANVYQNLAGSLGCFVGNWSVALL